MYGLIMRLTRSRFKLSVLMVHLWLNYTLLDVWLAVLIFTLRQLRRWRASRASVCLSCPVSCFVLLISNCWQHPGDIMVLIVTPNWWCEHSSFMSTFDLHFDMCFYPHDPCLDPLTRQKGHLYFSQQIVPRRYKAAGWGTKIAPAFMFF